ncbi:unnamed protein product [Clonostachys solani]|uniref:Uncharacterized protein n=1 Tax=Clonostachys solani TaxID=160281 RepID=A0A9N9Z1I9_9HYPO|nr:unnamed protein product [Clonostachys solani]
MGKVARTCKEFHSIMTPRLHRRVAYKVEDDAQLPQFIRLIQRYLSVTQNRKLRSQCRCEGQRDGVPYGSDLGANPPCAGYVREMIIGHIFTGRKGKYMVYRYLEEALKSMHGLEIVGLWGITRYVMPSGPSSSRAKADWFCRTPSAMAKDLAGLPNLKALSLTAQEVRVGDNITALASVKNLQHFRIRAWNPVREFEEATRAILLNSRLTLRSLVILNPGHETAGYHFGFLDDWQREFGSGSQTPYFPALQSLHLSGLKGSDEGLKRAFENAFDFMSLRSLTLDRIYNGRSALYRHLADLAARTPKEDIKLRSFQMDHHSDATFDEQKDDMETLCRFLGSFDTLTNLHLVEYNKYPAAGHDKGDLPYPLHQAILKHRDLTSLVLHSRAPYVMMLMEAFISPKVIATIMDSLPRLEEFEFAARSLEMAQVGEALARAKNLKTLSVTQIRGLTVPEPEALVTKIVTGVLDSRGGGSAGDEPFRWYNHSRLRRIITDRKRTFDIASEFWEVKDRRVKKPFSIRGLRNTEHEVLCRDVTALLAKDSPFVPDCDWADDVARDMI